MEIHLINEIKKDDLKVYEGKDRLNDRLWYHGVCSPDEIDRILNVQNASDYILKLRADTIVDNTRLWRVFLHLSKRYGADWSLEKYFTAYSYIDVRHRLPKELQEICKQVSFGSIISSDPNGLIFDTEYGICSTYSTTLKYFTRYSMLALLSFSCEVPKDVRLNAMRIAVRIMLQREALDFECDPRGVIPVEILSHINPIFPAQSAFLVGHEYSHLINGDLSHGSNTKMAVLKARFADETDYKMINSYNIKQKHEFEADLGALKYPKMSQELYSYQYHVTMLWFASLAIYEAAEHTIFPPYGFQSHPGAKARYNNILEYAQRPYDFDENFYCKDLPELVSQWEQIIIQDVQENTDLYEMYGSLYLGAPNTEWRGKELIDRVDY